MEHEALLYRTEDEFASAMSTFVLEGIASGDGVFVAAAPANLDALRSILGVIPSELHVVDAKDWYVKPAQTLGTFLSFIKDQLDEGRPAVRIIGEVVWPARDLQLRREWTRYESAINAVFAEFPVLVVCPYNTEHLTASTIVAARATHPRILEHGVISSSGRYRPPERLLPDLTVRMPLPTRHAERSFEEGDVVGPVAFVIDRAHRALLDADAESNAAAAASEIVMGAASRGRGPVIVATWTADREFVCQIEVETSVPADALAGYGPPLPEALDDWDLWLARQFSDLLEVGVGSRGTAVRLKMVRS